MLIKEATTISSLDMRECQRKTPADPKVLGLGFVVILFNLLTACFLYTYTLSPGHTHTHTHRALTFGSIQR